MNPRGRKRLACHNQPGTSQRRKSLGARRRSSKSQFAKKQFAKKSRAKKQFAKSQRVRSLRGKVR